ncbi:poly(3-hydroxybutyrate) depolymerase [Aureococcus anophagefferens]|nr:poly(3-hydroxybutyrate) depolymerase [Aureococcus anophagefferens]
MDAIPWRSSRLPEAAAALVIVSSVALRWLVRFALRRRRGVVVNRHAYHPVDLLRSVVFSVSQTQGGNWVLISGFVCAVFRRILRRRGAAADTPIILLLYGVAGTRDDHYMKHLALTCAARGWRPVALTYWRLDWNETRDLDNAVEQLRKTHPSAPLFCVAHSASAFLLVQYLARKGSACPLVAAVTLAGCMDFLRTYEFVKRTKNITYRKVFDRGMRRCVRRHAAYDPHLENRKEHAARIAGITDGACVMYDRHVAAIPKASNLPRPGYLEPEPPRKRLSGRFSPLPTLSPTNSDAAEPPTPTRGTPNLLERTREHYVAPSRERLLDVAIPLLVVHACDDPLVSHDDCYDWHKLVSNARIIAVRTNRGGHNAWHEGFWPLGPSWAVGAATDYISAVLEQTAQTGWLLAVLGRLDASRNPTASAIARAAAATDHVLEQPPPPPATPLNSVSAILFEEDPPGAAPAAATPAPEGDRALRRSSRSDADLDDNLDDGLEETAPDDRESFLGF